GTMTARFRQPIYEGDDVTVRGATVLGGDGVRSADLEAVNGAGEVCAVGAAALAPTGHVPPSIDAYPQAELPTERHRATPDGLAGLGVLGTAEVDFDVLLGADGVRPVRHVRHSAIYRLRPLHTE